ncbi:McrBC 5-methylcytosine restriction system component [Frondihabitans peucedani]|uniref:McrBC 5-methylcytosine restriction system component n=2 Tax=Frondihabitans peucedani TaxID=598626 RepID=A0ABP8DWR8_9MICO
MRRRALVMETLDLSEGRRIDALVLPRTISAALTSENIATLVPRPEADTYELSNIRKVGTIVIDGTVVRIQPKTPIRRLFALLGYARDPAALWRADDIEFDSDVDLYSAVAHAFARSSSSALAGGVLRGYVVREEALPVVRGRWRVTDQITRRAGQILPLEVVYDDYVDDIPENRALKSAAIRLLRFPNLPKSTILSLRRTLRLLDDVATLPAGSGMPGIRIDRRNVRYRGALALARLILTDSSLEHRQGSVVGSGFLVDSWTVFEDFVGAALGEALERRGGIATTQYRSWLDTAGRVSIAPDLIWEVDGRVAACIDLKYKIEHRGAYPNADLYQLVAYCTRFGLDTGHLVYAAGDSEPGIVDVVDGPTILQHALDLDAPFGDLLAQVDELAGSIARSEHRGGSSSRIAMRAPFDARVHR